MSDQIIKGLEWIRENQTHGVTDACDDLILKAKKLQADNERMRECVEYFVKRVEEGTIRSRVTYEKFVKALQENK